MAFIDYTGKTAVVTGGASGVGAALVPLLAELGATVTVVDRNDPPADLPGMSGFVKGDLSSQEGVDGIIAALPDRIDVLFNNAGVAATFPNRVVIAVNYLALRRLSEQLLDRIPQGGSIVNTASMAGQGWPRRLNEINELIAIGDWDKTLEWVDSHEEFIGDVYPFSKEINQVWTARSAHATLAKGVRTNSACPGIIDTPLLTDFRATMGEAVIDWTVGESTGKLCTPKQVADVLTYLGSDAASLVNGHNLYCDYGFSSAMANGQVDFSKLG